MKLGLLLGLSALSFAAFAGTELKLTHGTFNTADLVAKSAFVQMPTVASDYVIQFKNSVKESDKKALASLNVRIFGYLPDDALIVRAQKSVLEQYAKSTGKVNGIVPFVASWKMSGNLPTISVFSIGQNENIIVTAFAATDRLSIQSQITKLDPQARILASAGRVISIVADLSHVPEIALINGIEFIEKAEPITTMDMDIQLAKKHPAPVDAPPTQSGNYADLTGFESGAKVLNIPSAWAQGYDGEGQIAAMADTGLDLGDASTVSADFQHAVHSGYADGIGAKDWSDPMGHGTHVAGSILGRGVISGGKILGGAHGATLVVEGMWSPIVDNLTVPPQLSDLFGPAYNDGARIHSNSWGAASNFGAYDSMAQQVDQFMWDHPDFLLLYAAGNSGVDMDKDGRIDPNSIGTPGTAKNCLTIGASKNYVLSGGIQKKISDLKAAPADWSAEPIFSSSLSENQNGLAMFSSRGPTQDNRIKPDVVAPGTNILSTRSHVSGAELLWGAYNDDYLWSGGTSMATPLSAGFATVARQILVQKWKFANPSAALLKAVLMHTAFDMFPGQFGVRAQGQELLSIRPNNDEGYGRLDMNQVLALGNQSQLFDNNAGIGEGETFEQKVTLAQGQKLTANLVYTDAPGTLAAGQTLVNNLDLIVVTPDGQELGSRDTVNNSEVVDVPAASVAGTYKVQVRGVKIPMGKDGKQPFALVFSTL